MLDDHPVLVIVGPADGGRNALASAVAGLPPGPAWSRHVSRFGEHDIAYFGLRQLFPALHPGADQTPDAVEDATRDHLLGLRAPLPPIVLANADRCDPESVEILVRVASSGHVRLVATLPAEALAGQGRLTERAGIVDLPPLAAEVVSELLQTRFGVAPEPELVDLLLERSDGVYARVCDLADTAVASGAVVTTGAILALDTAAASDHEGHPVDRLSSRWEPLPRGRQELTDLVHLTSLLGLVDLNEARAHFPADVVELLLARGDLQVADDVVRFASDVEAGLVRRGLSHQRQIDLLQRFATLLPRTLARPGIAVQAGDWWLAGGRPLPVDLASRAAREANLTGRYRRAVVFTDPANVEGRTAVALIERIYALVEIGDYVTLRELYAGLDPAALTEEELLPYFLWLNRLRDHQDRTALGDRAVLADDPGVARRRTAVRTLSDLIGQAFRGSGETLASHLRALTFTSLLSPPNRAIAFTALATVLRTSGRPAQAVEAVEFALTLLDAEGSAVSAFHLDTVREYHVLALVTAVELDRAKLAVQAYSTGPFSQPGSGRLTTAMHALVHLHRGDATLALTNLRLCLAGIREHDPRHVRGWLQAALALILVQSDRPTEAAELLEASGSGRTSRAQWDLEQHIAQAVVLDALAEPQQALELLEAVIDEARERQLLLAQIEATALSVMILGPPQLPALLALVDPLVDPTGTVAVWQSFARAARDHDLTALVAQADDLDERQARLLSATVAQYILDVARRPDDLDATTRFRMQQLSDPRIAADIG